MNGNPEHFHPHLGFLFGCGEGGEKDKGGGQGRKEEVERKRPGRKKEGDRRGREQRGERARRGNSSDLGKNSAKGFCRQNYSPPKSVYWVFL